MEGADEGRSWARGGRLMPGENPGTSDVDEARSWRRTYSELRRSLLFIIDESITPSSPLRRLLQQCDRRLQFWEHKTQTLEHNRT